MVSAQAAIPQTARDLGAAHVLDAAGGPIQWFIAARWLRDKDSRAVARFIHAHRPKDVVTQWEKLENAQGLAFIAPVFWLHFSAILKGWFERVFAYARLRDHGQSKRIFSLTFRTDPHGLPAAY